MLSINPPNRDKAAEAQIDAKLQKAINKGGSGCYFETHELGSDPEQMAEKYRQGGWDVQYIDKVDSWLFQRKMENQDLDCW